ncbi:MAG: TetR/AcrR family transcriptional regulator [Comamonadaceae bacterium]|nr:MAG: TetR/AcrR family transcriptional regulator [Comamonadaceae bacterium]
MALPAGNGTMIFMTSGRAAWARVSAGSRAAAAPRTTWRRCRYIGTFFGGLSALGRLKRYSASENPLNANICALMNLKFNANKNALKEENPSEEASAQDEPRRRTGGRSARVLEAVANAALQELSESGIENFSLPAVAARAGVSSSSLYRRWPNKAALIAFACGRHTENTVPFPDCGSLRDDLVQVLEEVRDLIQDPKSRGMLAMAFSIRNSPEAHHTQSKFWEMRVEQQQAMFDRAVERGELDASADTGDIIERVVGPLYFRYFVSRRAVTDSFLRDLVDSVMQTLPTASVEPVAKPKRSRSKEPVSPSRSSRSKT